LEKGCPPWDSLFASSRVRTIKVRTNNHAFPILVRRKALRTLQRMILIMFGRVRSGVERTNE
jgi:hypothetical protein